MARLVALSDDDRRQYDLGALTSLGRHPNNTIRIPDGGVSKLHAQIHRLPDGSFILRDVGSLNGTFVRGRRVREIRLEDGDLIRMGTARLLFVHGAPSPTPLHRVSIGPTGEGGDEDGGTAFAPPAGSGGDGDGRGPATAEFLPASQIGDSSLLRADYERLRLGHELTREIGSELDLRIVLQKILDHALRVSGADIGAVLLVDLAGELVPRFVRARVGQEERDIVLSPRVLEEVRRRRTAFVSSAAGMFDSMVGPASGSAEGKMCLTVPFVHQEVLLGVMHLEWENGVRGFGEKDLQVISGTADRAAMAIQSAHLARKIERESQVRAQLSRLVPPGVVDGILRGELSVDQRGQLREVTVLHADIQGFAEVMRREAPEEVVRSLNESLEVLVEVLFRHGGTLDRFVGDELIGLFGSPLPVEDGPYHAAECGLEMVEALAGITRARGNRGRHPLRLGVGVATGSAIVGAIGSTWALQYAAIGKPVKEAEVLAASAGADEVILSEGTLDRVGGRIAVEEVPVWGVSGRGAGGKGYRVWGKR